jgi:hypothetical protein
MAELRGFEEMMERGCNYLAGAFRLSGRGSLDSSNSSQLKQPSLEASTAFSPAHSSYERGFFLLHVRQFIL